MRTYSSLKTALVYAQALYDSVKKAKELDALYVDACKISALHPTDYALLYQLDTPLWSIENKNKFLDQIFETMDINRYLCNTIKLLAQNCKLNILPIVLEQFISLYQQKHNIAEIEVVTAIPLNKNQDKLLKDKLTDIFKKDIQIKYRISPDIIGGLVIRYGTYFIDNSIQYKLKILEQLMKGIK